MPRPERFTELYFPDYHQLPTVISGKPHTISFTVHSLENQSTTYRYTVIAMSDDNHTKQQLAGGRFMLGHDQTLVKTLSIIVPALSNRMSVRVELAYQGIAFGSKTASLQSQSIDYWVNVVDAAVGSQAKHAAT